MFLGEDLLPYLVLAFGGALFVGNVLALIHPPAKRHGDRTDVAPAGDDDRARPPLGRTLLMATVGLVAAIWALASLVSG